MTINEHNMAQNPDTLSTRDKILLSTIALIEKEGLQNLTTRSIAKAAGVNSAAVNYYFRTKENLIDEILEYTLRHMFLDINEMYTDEQDFNSILRNILFYILQGSLKYPSIVSAHFHKPIIFNDYDVASVKQLNEYMEQFVYRIKTLEPGQDEERIRMKLLQLISASVLPAILPGVFKRNLGEDFFTDTEKQKKYIEELI